MGKGNQRGPKDEYSLDWQSIGGSGWDIQERDRKFKKHTDIQETHCHTVTLGVTAAKRKRCQR